MRRSGEGGGSKNGHGRLGRDGLVVGVGHGAERGAEHVLLDLAMCAE